MTKYIDAEKLKSEIKSNIYAQYQIGNHASRHCANQLERLLCFVDSLQQEESTEVDLDTQNPELTEFEEGVRKSITENLTTRIKDGGREICSTVSIDEDTARKLASKLLAIARKEIEKDLPRWKKGEGDDNVAVIMYEADTDPIKNAMFGEEIIPSLLGYKKPVAYYLTKNDLKKLPKEG